MSAKGPLHTETSELRGRPLTRPIRVVVVRGPDQGKACEITRGSALIGSHSDCDLALSDRGVSRRHLTVELVGGRLRVRDLGSKNGSSYLGAGFEALELPEGASVELGHGTTVSFVPVADEGPGRSEMGEMVGVSPAMRRVFSLVERLAPGDCACLITGETGTGKELVARTIHTHSPRAAGRFVVVECGALSPSLANATLFGHVRGAFTGAVQDSQGLIGEADGGTLFLDEIASLPLELQPLLLRALDTHTYKRVGETSQRTSTFRVIASTRDDLERAITEGRFRADLYYRIAAVTLQLPPLRSRPEDVPLLAKRFSRPGSPPLSDSVVATLSALRWPGNVRELRNAVEASQLLGVTPEPAPAETTGFYAARDRVLAAFEKSFLTSLLEQHQGSAVAVARAANIGRSQLYRLFEEHGIDPDDYRRSR